MGSFAANLPPAIPSSYDRCAPSVLLRTCTEQDNAMRRCISAETELWRRVAFNPAFPLLRLAARYRSLSTHPFDTMPVDGQRINVTPTTQTVLGDLGFGTYYPILSYLMPSGYDGVINSVLTKFEPLTGPALQDGSGMLTWVLQINNYLAVGYNQITIQQGNNSSLGPVAHSGGIRIKANDLVTMYAVVTQAGAAYLDPQGLVLGAIQGWIYPNR